MALEYSGLRYTPCEVPAGVGSTFELDITNIRSLIVAEMTRWGTGVGDVSLRFGDMGDFFDPSPGDGYYDFFPVKRCVIRNNTLTAKKIGLILHESGTFRLINTPRGV